MDKQTIREKYLHVRASIPADDALEKSQAIAQHCAEILTDINANTILSYKPLKMSHEINSLLIEKALPSCQYDYLPAHRSAHFPDGHYDAIIVPCIAADSAGFRLGYGGGWYDKFLSRVSSSTVIYICYESCLLNSLPHEPHDIRADYVVTEKRVIHLAVE